jgi:hypothetical protein
MKLTKNDLKELLREQLEHSEGNDRESVMMNWEVYFRKAGFVEHGATFRFVDAELIEMLGQTIKRYFANKRIRKHSNAWF